MMQTSINVTRNIATVSMIKAIDSKYNEDIQNKRRKNMMHTNSARTLNDAMVRTIKAIETKDSEEIQNINNAIDRDAEQGMRWTRVSVMNPTIGCRIAWYFHSIGYLAEYNETTKYLTVSWE